MCRKRERTKGRASVSGWALNDCEHTINEPTFYEWAEHTKSYWSNTWYCSFNGTCLSLCISNLILIITISYKYAWSMSGCALHHHEHFGRITAFIMHHIICWRKNSFGHFYEVLRLRVSEWVRASCCWCDCRTSLIITCFSTARLSQSNWKRNMILSLGEHISLEYLIFYSKHEIQWEKSQGIHQTNLLQCECVFNAHFDGNYLQIIISVHFVLGQKDICSFCIMFFFSSVVANTDTV